MITLHASAPETAIPAPQPRARRAEQTRLSGGDNLNEKLHIRQCN
jgi:hypothetical protein